MSWTRCKASTSIRALGCRLATSRYIAIQIHELKVTLPFVAKDLGQHVVGKAKDEVVPLEDVVIEELPAVRKFFLEDPALLMQLYNLRVGLQIRIAFLESQDNSKAQATAIPAKRSASLIRPVQAYGEY